MCHKLKKILVYIILLIFQSYHTVQYANASCEVGNNLKDGNSYALLEKKKLPMEIGGFKLYPDTLNLWNQSIIIYVMENSLIVDRNDVITIINNFDTESTTESIQKKHGNRHLPQLMGIFSGENVSFTDDIIVYDMKTNADYTVFYGKKTIDNDTLYYCRKRYPERQITIFYYNCPANCLKLYNYIIDNIEIISKFPWQIPELDFIPEK